MWPDVCVQLLCNQPSFNRLTEPDVVRNEKVHSWHLHSSRHRHELVRLNLYATPKRRLEKVVLYQGG